MASDSTPLLLAAGVLAYLYFKTPTASAATPKPSGGGGVTFGTGGGSGGGGSTGGGGGSTGGGGGSFVGPVQQNPTNAICDPTVDNCNPDVCDSTSFYYDQTICDSITGPTVPVTDPIPVTNGNGCDPNVDPTCGANPVYLDGYPTFAAAYPSRRNLTAMKVTEMLSANRLPPRRGLGQSGVLIVRMPNGVDEQFTGITDALNAAFSAGGRARRPDGSLYQMTPFMGGVLLDNCPLNVVFGQGWLPGQQQALQQAGLTPACPAVDPGAWINQSGAGSQTIFSNLTTTDWLLIAGAGALLLMGGKN